MNEAVKLASSCRHCDAPLELTLADLGLSPIANDYLPPERYAHAEPFFPLEVVVCRSCRLAQTRDMIASTDLFRSDYAYFSSHSTSWLDHARRYVEMMSDRFAVGADKTWVEIASNDGYLLQYVKAKDIRCLGVEPTEGPARAAMEKGIETRIAFFGRETATALAQAGWSADVISANNVLAHVPDINDFVGGAAILLKPEGVATFEIQHLLRLMQKVEFDTIYHEHFSYLSLIAAEKFFAAQGLRVFDVDHLPTHGGSIRFYVCHKDASHAESPKVAEARAEELAFGLDTDAAYLAWAQRVRDQKLAIMQLLIDLKRTGARIAGYGAAAKATTLLNYCGIGRDFIEFIADAAPSKQGRFLPGVRIPIVPPAEVMERKPDYLVILPWNLKDEIMKQMAGIREWGGKFVVPMPTPQVFD